MRGFHRLAVLVAVTCLIHLGNTGCESTRDPELTTPIAKDGPLTDVGAPADGDAAELAPPISQKNLDRLFSVAWVSNDRATVASPLNQGVDPDELKNYAWYQCIQWKTRVFFKDAGLKWTDVNGESLIDLPVQRDKFQRTICVIDDFHFAFFDGKHWLVFRAGDWEDRHYDPPM